MPIWHFLPHYKSERWNYSAPKNTWTSPKAENKNLPGLIQCHLYYELNHCVSNNGQVWDNEVLDLEHHESDYNASYNPLQNLLMNIALAQALKNLTPRQLKILWLYYFANKSHEAIAKKLKCAPRTIGYQRMQALKKLKTDLLKWRTTLYSFLSRAFLIYIYYKLVVTIGNKVEKLRFSYTGQEKKERKKINKRRRGKKNLTNIVGRFFLNRQIFRKKK